jgi:protein SCO1/2
VNRNAIRILGIAVGLLAGTIAALMFRGTPAGNGTAPMRAGSNTQLNEENEDTASARKSPPDPGKRNELKQMVSDAKKEAAWLKEFELIERSGRTVKSEDLRGEPYVACFFFSTCPGSCTRQSNQMQLLQSKFKGKPIKFVSITVDPEIDTPEVLTEYADKFQASDKWLFLTGSLDYIMRVGAEKFFLGHVEKRGHPDQFCLVNAEGDLVGSYAWQELAERELLVAHANALLEGK